MEESSIEDMVKRHLVLKKEIDEKTKAAKILASRASKLKEDKDMLRDFILSDQINEGKILKNPALDYCFRHYGEKIYEHLELVNEFREQVKKYSGQQILTVKENQKLDIGIISGECEFEVDKTFRYLYVPVKDLQTFQVKEGYTGNWKKGEDKIWINDDIFNAKKIRFKKSELCQKLPELLKKDFLNNQNKDFGAYWEGNYSKQMVVGGPRPKNWHVYIGDKIVKHNLEKHLEMNIPSTKVVIPFPLF